MSSRSVPVTIYHNPACGTSRNTLALIRNAGVEPTVIEYLKTPPDRATLIDLLGRMGMRPRELLREKRTPYAELELAADRWSDARLIGQMLAHRLLINRPIVVTPWGCVCAGPKSCHSHRRVLSAKRTGSVCSTSGASGYVENASTNSGE